MAAQSSDFLSVHDNRRHGRHRSRSGGHLDFLAEQEKDERRKHGMQMKRYHDSRYTSHVPPASSDNALYVPPHEGAGHRRVRSYEEMGEKKEDPVRTYEKKGDGPVRTYNLREQKPTYGLNSDAPLPSELPVHMKNTWKPQKGPSIKVQIHQHDTPSTEEKAWTPRKSPMASASPRSPKRPQLEFQFAILQVKLETIEATCAPNLHVEAANPRDLTFAKIAEEVRGYAFQLKMWGQIANIENLARIDVKKRQVVEQASHTLDRLVSCVTDLSAACAKAKPRDLKISPLPEIDDDDDDMYDDYTEDEDGDSVQVVTESPGFVIQSYLYSLRLNIQTLGRLTRSLQEASPDFRDEAVGVEQLIEEVDEFFGTKEALERYSIDERFAGRKALEEARHHAEVRGLRTG